MYRADRSERIWMCLLVLQGLRIDMIDGFDVGILGQCRVFCFDPSRCDRPWIENLRSEKVGLWLNGCGAESVVNTDLEELIGFGDGAWRAKCLDIRVGILGPEFVTIVIDVLFLIYRPYSARNWLAQRS